MKYWNAKNKEKAGNVKVWNIDFNSLGKLMIHIILARAATKREMK